MNRRTFLRAAVGALAAPPIYQALPSPEPKAEDVIQGHPA